MKTSEDLCTVPLRLDQWDFIVMGLERLCNMTSGPESPAGIDKLGRRVVRKRADEIIKAIQVSMPQAGVDP